MMVGESKLLLGHIRPPGRGASLGRKQADRSRVRHNSQFRSGSDPPRPRDHYKYECFIEVMVPRFCGVSSFGSAVWGLCSYSGVFGIRWGCACLLRCGAGVGCGRSLGVRRWHWRVQYGFSISCGLTVRLVCEPRTTPSWRYRNSLLRSPIDGTSPDW